MPYRGTEAARRGSGGFWRTIPGRPHLNTAGIRTRDGGRCGTDAVHKVLTRTTYIGRHRFNTKFWKTRERKPETEVVEMTVPAIIEPAEFEAVLGSRSPRGTRGAPGDTYRRGLRKPPAINHPATYRCYVRLIEACTGIVGGPCLEMVVMLLGSEPSVEKEPESWSLTPAR
jgi:Recombinase